VGLLTRLRLERALASKQFDAGRFRNTSRVTAAMQGSSVGIAGEFLFGGGARVPRAPLPVESPLGPWSRPPPRDGLRLTWLGHSTVLLEIDGVRILTDPVFAERASPVRFAGPRRFHRVPATIAELPPLDAVLVSHDHHDHLCAQSVAALAARGERFVTSLGVGAHLERFGVPPAAIVELDWWETHALPGADLSLTATPAQHFSGRALVDRNATLWSSWVLASRNRKVFFSGDTGLTDEFRSIGERLGPFDLVMLEIGAFHPAWGGIHLGPENALTALERLGGGTLFPVHWSTFDLALHPWDEPAETLVAAAAVRGARVVTPPLGRVVEPRDLEGPTPWWRSVAPGVLVPLVPS
jgi:L-ascorbate metabolism protein UlaG (beta-lactamase superfamily)